MLAQNNTPLRFLTEHSPPGEYFNEQGVATGVTVDSIGILQQRLDESGDINILPWGRAMTIAEKKQDSHYLKQYWKDCYLWLAFFNYCSQINEPVYQ